MKHLRPFLSLAFFCAGTFAADVAIIEEIIAKVNGEIITRSELEKEREQLRTVLARQQNLSGAALEEALRQREADILREKIDELLLVQKAKDLSINVDGELSKYIAQLRADSKIVDEEKFQQWVKEQAGMPFEDFRSEARNGMLTRRIVQQEVGRLVNISRAEVQKHYEEHKSEFQRDERVFLREILVSTEGKDEAGKATAEKKAKDLVARARKGERFHELARDHSDAITGRDGGALGGFKRGELDPQLEAIVFAEERGHVTDPILRPNGYLILRVEEHHKAGLASLEEVENEIMETLYMPRFQPKVREYLTKLRDEAFLEIREGYVDSGAAPGKDTRWSDPAELKPETVTKEEVASQTRRRRLLWLIPIPGTQTSPKSSSR